MLVGELVTRFVADMSSFDRGIRQSRREVDDMSKSASKMGDSLRRALEFAGGQAIWQVFERAAASMKNFVKESVLGAARVEEMNYALSTLGKNSGVVASALDRETEAIRKMGITTEVAQNTLAQFMRFNLDTAKSAEVARVAQDAAILAQADSSETLNRIIYGITTRQTEILRTAGLQVNFEQANAKMAQSLGKSINALSEAEKTQAALNAVLAEGVTIQGAYDAAMESAGKQMRSTARYMTDLKVNVGEMFTPIFSAGVYSMNESIKLLTEIFDPSGGISQTIKSWSYRVSDTIRHTFSDLKFQVDKFISTGGVDRIGKKMNEVFGELRQTGNAGMALGAAFGAAKLGGVLGLGPVGAMAAGLATLLITTDETRNALVDLGKSAGAALGQFVSALLPGLEALSSAFTFIAPALADLIAAIGQGLVSVAPAAGVALTAIAQAAAAIVVAITPLVQLLASLTAVIAENQAAVIALAGAYATLKVAGGISAIAGGEAGLKAGLGAMLAHPAAAAVAVAALVTVGAAYWKLTSDIQSNEQAMERHTAGFRQMIENLEPGQFQTVADEWTRASDQILEAQAKAFTDTGIGRSGTGIFDILNDVLNMGPGGAWDFITRFQGAEKEMDDIWQQMGDTAQRGASEFRSTVTKMSNDIEDTMTMIEASMHLPISSWDDVANLLPAQAKQIQDQFTTLQTAVKGWSDSIGDFSGMLTKSFESKGQASLEQMLGGTLNTLMSFRTDLSKLTDLGAGSDIISSLLKAGPEKVGPALRAQMESIGGMAEPEARKVVAAWNEQMAWIADEQNRLLQDMAVKMMQGTVEVNTEEQAAELIKQHNDLKNQVTDALSRMDFGIANVDGLRNFENMYRDFLANVGSMTADEAKTAGAGLERYLASARNTVPEEQRAIIDAMINDMGSLARGMPALNESSKSLGKLLTGSNEAALKLTEVETSIASKRSALVTLQGIIEDQQYVLDGMMDGPLKEGVRRAIEQASSQAAVLQGELDGLLSQRDQLISLGAPVEVPKALQDAMNAESAASSNAAISAQNAAKAQQEATKAAQQAKDPVEELARAYDKVYDAVGDAISSTHSFAQAQADLAEVLGSNALSGKHEAEDLRAIEQAAIEAASSLREQAFALAESGAIGKDVGSINAFISNGLDQLSSNLQAAAEAWMRENDEMLQQKMLAEELEKVWGRLMTAQQSQFSIYRTFIGLQDQLVKAIMAVKPTQREMVESTIGVKNATLDAIKAIESEAYALAAAGKIGSDAASIYNFIVQGLNSLKGEISDVNGLWGAQAEQLMTLEQRLARVNELWQEYLGVVMGAESASISLRSAVEQLDQIYEDTVAILQNDYLNSNDQQKAQDQLTSSLQGVVKAIQQQAIALAQAGKIGSDAASMNKYLEDQLKALALQYPELADEINTYLGALGQIPDTTATESKLYTDTALAMVDQYIAALGQIPPDKLTTPKVDISVALGVINQYKNSLRSIPSVWTTYMQVDTTQANAAVNTFVQSTSQRLNMLHKTLAAYTQAVNAVTRYMLDPSNGNYAAAQGSVGYYMSMSNSLGVTPQNPWEAVPGYFLAGALAEGGIVSYANGGGWEQHVAGISRTMRMWAEPETGGEAYLPLGIAKRARSTAFLAYVNEMFGDPLGAHDGGKGGVSIGELHVHTDESPRQWLDEAEWRLAGV